MDRQAIADALGAALASALLDPAHVVLAPAGVPGALRSGFHCHDGWEIFIPLGERLRFEVAGHRPMAVAAGSALLVRPGCLHFAIHRIPQRAKLTTLIVSCPQSDARFGGVSVDALDRVLSRAELAAWTSLARAAPAQVMERAAVALEGRGFARERALAELRLLLSALGEVAFGSAVQARDERAELAARAEGVLRREYYRADLGLEVVAQAVGASPSHLARQFRRATGRSVHQTLIQIRLRRARGLLRDPALSIKEVADLTGWSDALYFSSVFSARFGIPPSRARRR